MISSEKTVDSSDVSRVMIHMFIMKNELKHDSNLFISPKKGKKVIHDSNLTHESSINYREVLRHHLLDVHDGRHRH